MPGLVTLDDDVASAGQLLVQVSRQRDLVDERGKSGAHAPKIILHV